MVWVAEHLQVFPNGLQALGFQFAHNINGHPRYLMGDLRVPALLGITIPALLTIKLSLPLLALPVVLGLARRRSLANWACVVGLALLAFSLICRVQIRDSPGPADGGRGGRSAWGRRRRGAIQGMAGRGAVAARLAVRGDRGHVCCRWRSPWGSPGPRRNRPGCWPDGLRYVNGAWGGPAEGYRLVSDCELRLGPGGSGVECAGGVAHEAGPARGLVLRDRPGDHRVANYLNLNLKERPEDAAEAVRTRFWGSRLAVSTTMLYGPYRESRSDWIALLKSRRPVDRTSTFLIYDFSEPDAVAARPGLVR